MNTGRRDAALVEAAIHARSSEDRFAPPSANLTPPKADGETGDNSQTVEEWIE
jgi:hypothetical protein